MRSQRFFAPRAERTVRMAASYPLASPANRARKKWRCLTCQAWFLRLPISLPSFRDPHPAANLSLHGAPVPSTALDAWLGAVEYEAVNAQCRGTLYDVKASFLFAQQPDHSTNCFTPLIFIFLENCVCSHRGALSCSDAHASELSHPNRLS